MSSRLADKVAIVTGASKGIGAAIARRFGAEGASVVVNYASDQAGACRVVEEIEGKGGKAIAVQADLSKQEDIVRLFAAAKGAYGRLDVLVNNAGVYEFRPVEGVTSEHFHKQFDLNVLGLVLASKEAAAHFDAAGGSIINIGSVAGASAPPTGSVYSATKAAVDAITKSLAKELGPRGIRVNSLNPGMIETEGFHASGFAGSEFQKQGIAGTPLGRMGQPEDIAPVAVFFASSDSAWVTGETLYVSGGAR